LKCIKVNNSAFQAVRRRFDPGYPLIKPFIYKGYEASRNRAFLKTIKV
jgi:hypothetical protein